MSAPRSNKILIDKKQQRIQALCIERRQLNSESKAIAINKKILEKEYAQLSDVTQRASLKPIFDAIARTTQQQGEIANRLSVVKSELKRAKAMQQYLLEQQVSSNVSWVELYDAADMEIKRLVVSCLLNQVTISRDYKINIECGLVSE